MTESAYQRALREWRMMEHDDPSSPYRMPLAERLKIKASAFRLRIRHAWKVFRGKTWYMANLPKRSLLGYVWRREKYRMRKTWRILTGRDMLSEHQR